MTQTVPSPASSGVFCLFPFRTGDCFSPILAKVFFPIFLVLILAAPLSYPAHAADDYLKAIEAEGNRLEFLGQAKKEQEMLMRDAPPARESQKIQLAPKKAAKAAPSRAEFELALRKSFPGSFALYSLLEPQEKEAVFNEYDRSTSEGTIRFLPAVSKIISFNSTANKAR